MKTEPAYIEKALAALKALANKVPGTSTARHLLRTHALQIIDAVIRSIHQTDHVVVGRHAPGENLRTLWAEAAKLNDYDFAVDLRIEATGPVVNFRRRRGGFAQIQEGFDWLELAKIEPDQITRRLARGLETIKGTRVQMTLRGTVWDNIRGKLGPAAAVRQALAAINEELSVNGYRLIESDMRDGCAERCAFDRVLELAQRQLDQDRRALSGPSITLEMLNDVEEDQAAIERFKRMLRNE